MQTDLLKGKRGLIMGLANDKSIAWGIAKCCREAGAELAFSYQGEQLLKRVTPLAAEVGSDIVLPCDVGDMESVDGLFEALRERWGGLDFLLHSIAFAPKDDLHGRVVDCSAEGFAMWFRMTLCLHRAGEGWRITHEHVSTPFYMDGSFRTAVDLQP